MSNPQGPFGDPDGSREHIQNMDQWFVRPTDEDESDYSRARILVGGKGSGKTILLRIMHDNARRDRSRYTAPTIASSPPPTDSIVRFCESVRRGSLADAWDAVWRCAILRSTVSHLQCMPELAGEVSGSDHQKLLTKFPEILEERVEARDIYAELNALLAGQERDSALLRLLHNPQWDDLETLLERVLVTLPPLYFYVDGLDEKFERAPAHWLQCQRGLFDRVIGMMRRRVLGERLHIVISIRDSVYYSALRSEHRTRYVDERVVRLHWDAERLQELLRKKVDQLPPPFLFGGAIADTPVERWLGIDTIANQRRRLNESVFGYLRRHLRPAPRDFVVLGNEVCQRQVQVVKPRKREIQDLLRTAVASTASHIGMESLFICAAQIAADQLPPHAATRGFSDFFVATDHYRDSIVDDLSKLLRSLPGDRFDRGALALFDDKARQEIQWDVDVPSGLWQCGLLGYVVPGQKERHLFWFTSGDRAWTIPHDVDEYVLHPSLIDALQLKSVGSTPVLPEL